MAHSIHKHIENTTHAGIRAQSDGRTIKTSKKSGACPDECKHFYILYEVGTTSDAGLSQSSSILKELFDILGKNTYLLSC